MGAKYEKSYFKANIEFKKAEKSVVDEKKAKKRALVKETRDQLKESIQMYRFTKRNGSKNQLKLIKREIRGNRKSIGKITKVETAKHNYLKKKRQVAWAYKKAGQRLERIIAAKFRKQKRIFRQAVKAGRRRATAKAKKMLESIKAAHAKTQAKILKVKIAEARENVKFSKENIAIAKKDGNVEEITEAKKEAKRALRMLKNNKKAKKSQDKQQKIKDTMRVAVEAGKRKIMKKYKKKLRRERRKFKKAGKKQLKVDLKETIQAVKDAKEELEEAEIDEVKDDIKKARLRLKIALRAERQTRAQIFNLKVQEAKKNYIEAKDQLEFAIASGRKSLKDKAQKRLNKKETPKKQ